MPDDSDAALEALCAHFGIATGYHDIWGQHHTVPPEHLSALLAEFGVPLDAVQGAAEALEAVRRAAAGEPLPPVLVVREQATEWELPLRLPIPVASLRWQIEDEAGACREGELDALEWAAHGDVGGDAGGGAAGHTARLRFTLPLSAGYHRLRIDGLDGETLVICAPAQGWRPTALRDGGRVWGPAVQLHALRSPRNWGIGDFGDLARLAEQVARLGADIIGLNPLHALFPHNPAHASPYSPSSRQHLHVLYLDVEALDDFTDCEAARRLVASDAFRARLTALRDAPLIDHAGVAAAKFEVLELLFAHFRERHLSPDGTTARDGAGRAFLAFVAERGEALRRHALFEALQAHFHAADPGVWGWPAWPEAWRDSDSAEVAAFAAAHPERVQYRQYLQWLTASQLARVNARCKALGMGVGLYLDLAVSADRAGADAWSERALVAASASIGAPPDAFNASGQNWGLPPLRPDRLRATGYRFLIDTLRANMRAAGALRIDHVMGFMRLFWIPPGHTARDGAYVHYPMEELLAIVALESRRQHCLVIGEDLGTVAPEMREAMAQAGVLSYRLLFFEREADGGFIAPARWPPDALAAVGTHDLPTFSGWWCGHDLQLRLDLGLLPAEALEPQRFERAQARARLLQAVQRAGLLPVEALAQAADDAPPSRRVVEAVHAFVAATPSAVMMVQLEDVLGVAEQVNMPGTTAEQPNWRRRLPMDMAAPVAAAALQDLARVLGTQRPRHGGPGAAHTRVPRATYRLQLHKDFGFEAAAGIVPYLARLGVSHVYCSPIQRARAGSMHGYDVVAHDEINPELGGRAGFDRFTDTLAAHAMGLLLDLVPNHMGVMGADNAWWMDVLENGPCSLYAQHFDIDWQPLNPELAGKVLVPVLGDHYGDVLDAGDLVLRFDADAGSLALHYFEHRFPIAPESYPGVLRQAGAQIGDSAARELLAAVADAFTQLPGRDATAPETRALRAGEKELLKARLAQLAGGEPAVRDAIAARVSTLNRADMRDALHALIEAQAWRIAWWRVAADDINYRRFFDVNDLAALRIEREEVFEATQSLALDLAARGRVDGLRIDHPDGLYDPARYFRQLQEGYARRIGLTWAETDATGRPARPLYVVAEKIAAGHEEVPQDWHIHGTTGYRFANVANGVLVDADAAVKFVRTWRSFTGVVEDFEALARAGKRDVMRSALASELTVLTTELLRIARADRRTRDYTFNALHRALAEVTARLPVYRTYVMESASAQDARYIDQAARAAAASSPDPDVTIFDFIRRTLRGELATPDTPPHGAGLRQRVQRFASRFQQFSAPVMAKGVEDTAFYRYFPLSSLNEVGGEPSQFGLTVAAFHTASADRALHWPHTMLATSTHDNKRSEDVRCRIDVLSEMPAAWRLTLRRWRGFGASVRRRLVAAGAPADAPSRADEYLLYQTLLGTLPVDGTADTAAARDAYAGRIARYMVKAARESKRRTRWTSPDEGYERALESFVHALLAPAPANRFPGDLRALATPLAWFGALNSLSLTLLKYGSPGVPDLYQGNELMDLSLVDPDNRRPVDYALRRRQLEAFEAMAHAPDLPARVAALAAAPHDGRAKMWLAWRLMTLRRAEPALWRDGSYVPLAVEGERAVHVVAFARQHADRLLVIIAGRLFAHLAPAADGPAPGDPPIGAVWQDTTVTLPALPAGGVLRDVITGRTLHAEEGALRLAIAFAHFPGAALWVEREG